MKVKKVFLFAIALGACLAGFAQGGKLFAVKGQVVDSASQAALEFSTVSIKNKVTNSEKKVVTGKDGSFILPKLSPGKYVVEAVVTGYRPVTVSAELTDTLNLTVDLGMIVLPRLVKQLEGVTVVTKKPLITQEIDRISYNVQEDPDSKVFNMLDMMRKVPFIAVTGEDQVLFKGNSNFKVLLDGRSSSLLSMRNLKDVLKGLPASSILQIEVITVPPARYESEGLAGIINIITNKKLKDGYNGSFNANYSRLFSGGSASINIKKGKFGITGFAGVSSEQLPVSTFSTSLSQVAPVSFELLQSGDRKFRGNMAYGNTYISFEADTLNLFTASFGINAAINRHKNNQFSQLFDENDVLAQSYRLASSRESHDNGWDAGLNYQRGFKRNKAQYLTLSYKFVSFSSDLDNASWLAQKVNYPVNDIRQNNKSGTDEHSVQLDYVHPVKSVTIEAGGKLIHRGTFSDFAHSDFNTSTGQFEPDAGKSDMLDYDQAILSAYNSYLLRKKTWAVRAGFRVEKTMIDANFRSTGTKLDRDYTNLMPSVSYVYRFKDMSSMNIGYTQRIQRPGIQLLNPFVDRSDPRFFRSGNPDLLPVRNHTIVATYSRFKKSTINLGLNYTFARNTIQSVSSSQGADSIIRIAYQNIGQYDNVGANLNLSFPIGKSFTLTTNGTMSYVWIKGIIENSPVTNQGIEGFAYAYLSYRAKKNWRASLNAGFYGPVRNLQGNSNSYFYSSVSVSRQVLKEKGTLSFSVSNPFQKFRTLRTEVNAEAFYQQTVYKNYFRNINIGFYYRFGKLKEEIKRNKKSINNDDKAVETGKTQ